MCTIISSYFLFFFNDTATTEIYTLSLHDALPISFERHVAHNLLDVNKSRLSLELQFRFFRHGQLQTSSRIRRLRRGVQNRGGDVDAVTGLFHVKTNLVGGLAGDDGEFPIFPGLHFDAAVGGTVD